MKKRYYAPEEEFIIFDGNEVFNTTGSCPDDCPDDCSQCFYLVCQPQDVIIGGKAKQSSGSKKSSESPKNPVGFDMTFNR